jgi:hypothetical protein
MEWKNVNLMLQRKLIYASSPVACGIFSDSGVRGQSVLAGG